MQMRAFMRVGSSFSDQDLGVNPSHEGACYDILSVYWYDIVGQSSKSLGTHGVCAKQFCTSIPVCPMGDLIPCTCADIQIRQRALVALIRIAHGRRILRFIYAMLAFLRHSPGTLVLILLA